MLPSLNHSQMPNWTTSCVHIKGDSVTLKRIAESDFEFQSLYPCPFIHGEKSSDGWYRWCCIHWGTKWGPRDVEITSDIDDPTPSLTIVFRTAWATPHGLLAYLTSMNPSLEITNEWSDEGAERVGLTVYKDGTIVSASFDPSEYTINALKIFAVSNAWFDVDSYESYYNDMVEGSENKEWIKDLLPEVKLSVLKDTLPEFRKKMEALYVEV